MKRRRIDFFNWCSQALATLCLSVLCAASAQATSYLNLSVDCVHNNGDGTYTAHFGYQNNYRDDGFLVITPAEDGDNVFSPGETDRGQPANFKYGNFPGQFSVTWDGTPLTWYVHYRVRGVDYESSVTADASNTEQQTCKVIPYADCLLRRYAREENGNWYESYDTYFSYFNPGEAVTIPKGTDNHVSHSWCTSEGCPAELEQNQPETFDTGHHRGVFRVNSLYGGQYGNTSDTYWLVNLPDVGTVVGVSQWNYTRECDLTPIAECLEMGCQVPEQNGNKTAWFGYRNGEPFTVRSDVPNYYNGLRQSYGCEYDSYDGYDQFGRACFYPQPETFEPGVHNKVFGVCFSGLWNGGEGGSSEGLPPEEMGLNNQGYVQWQLGSNWYYNYNNNRALVSSESRQCNRAPDCNVGDYNLPCTGVSTNVFLQGDMSKDPDNDGLTYEWSHDCKKATLLGVDSATPVLGLFMPQDCTVNLTVTEEGTDEAFSTSCSGKISVAACTSDITSLCEGRDMNPTEFLLATGANDQRRLIERIVGVLMKVAPDRSLSRALHGASRYGYRNRDLSWTYPDMIRNCPESFSCSSVSLSNISDKYARNSGKLNKIAKRLVRKLKATSEQSLAKRYGKRRRDLNSNIRKLLQGLPTETSSC